MTFINCDPSLWQLTSTKHRCFSPFSSTVWWASGLVLCHRNPWSIRIGTMSSTHIPRHLNLPPELSHSIPIPFFSAKHPGLRCLRGPTKKLVQNSWHFFGGNLKHLDFFQPRMWKPQEFLQTSWFGLVSSVSTAKKKHRHINMMCNGIASSSGICLLCLWKCLILPSRHGEVDRKKSTNTTVVELPNVWGYGIMLAVFIFFKENNRKKVCRDALLECTRVPT